jgi:hypothetical protein
MLQILTLSKKTARNFVAPDPIFAEFEQIAEPFGAKKKWMVTAIALLRVLIVLMLACPGMAQTTRPATTQAARVTTVAKPKDILDKVPRDKLPATKAKWADIHTQMVSTWLKDNAVGWTYSGDAVFDRASSGKKGCQVNARIKMVEFYGLKISTTIGAILPAAEAERISRIQRGDRIQIKGRISSISFYDQLDERCD